jgi:phage shock protein PspC (stress-responsive transcriptional regulator)
MDTDTDDTTALGEGPRPTRPPDGRLRRSRHRRMLAGVAGGIAERYDVDVSLVRVAFVVLACAWGAGIVLYGAMWALVPREPAPGDPADADAEPAPSWLALLLLAGVLVLGLLLVTSWWGGPRWGGGLGLLWVVLLCGVLVVALRRPSGGSLLKALLIVGVGLVTTAILLAGAFFALVASTGVPLEGGIGDRVFQPASVAQVQPTYRTAIGNMTVDLRRVRFGVRTVHVTATVAVGVVTVEVPPSVVVDVSAHSGVGNVVSFPGSLQSFASQPTRAAHDAVRRRPQLVLVAEAGVGQVRLVRAPPSAAYPFT